MAEETAPLEGNLTPLLSTTDAAEYLGVTPNALRLRVLAGTLPAVRTRGRAYQFRREDLDRWLEDHSIRMSGR